MKVCSILLALMTFALTASAQQSRILPPTSEGGQIMTLRTEVEGVLESLPILRLGTGETVRISFDEMSHEYHRYVYRLEHCDFGWNPTEGLFYSEYAESTQDEVPIEEYTESRNVTTHYTHYVFDFPNADMRPLISGNYRITILSDDGDEPEPVAEVCLCMTEGAASVAGGVTTNTEIDMNDAHQQLEMTIDGRGLPVRDARRELRAVVLQNDRWDNAAVAPSPSYVNGSKLIWEHNRALIFPAGNEYRKFEILSARYPGLHTESIRYHAPFLHATIMDDAERRNYLVAEDQNGINVIRNVDNQDDETETEYMITHFTLEADEELEAADVYLNARWTTGGLAPEWQLRYDAERRAYVGAFMLKQGYYNYQYLVVPRSSRASRSGRPSGVGQTRPFEGDYYQTSNDYRVLIYFTQDGARYDRLVGTGLFRY